MDSSHSLTFLWTPLGLAAAAVIVLATAFFAVLAWHRSGYARSTGWLEALRVVIVLLVVLTINQPEWLQQFSPEDRPTLLVLADASRSMQTQDVIDEDRPSAPPRTRGEVIRPLLEPEVWQTLAEELEVVFQPFSSSLEEPSEGTDLHGALAGALQRHRNLRGIVLISDGDWNVGQAPVYAASQLRSRNIPVFPIAVGSPSRLPDIELKRLDAPTFGPVGKPIRIPFVIDSTLPRDYEVEVSLVPSADTAAGEASSAGTPISRRVTIPAMAVLEDAITWKPQTVGEYQLTMRVPPHGEELVHDNNEITVPISIRQETLKVLLIESYPRWEYRYLRNALERDPGVDVSCLLLHPDLKAVGGGKGYIAAFPGTLEELSGFDVVFLGDVGIGDRQLTVEQARLIKGLVHSQASGLILMPGPRGAHLTLSGTELDELYPVVLDTAQPRGWGARIPEQFALSSTGRRSLLTKLEEAEQDNAHLWETLPGFQWYAPVLRAKAGSEVLATHKTASNRYGRLPLLVTKTYGTGKVLFMGTDGAWRWREGVEDRYHYRFWGQVARWMAYQRSMAQHERMRLFYSPDQPQSEERVTLNANVMSDRGEPLQNGTVVVEVVAPSGKSNRVRLAATGDQWGLFTGSFLPAEAGKYRLTLQCAENESSLETTVTVQGLRRERLGQPLRRDVLEEIAAVSGGKMATAGELSQLQQAIAALPQREPIVRRLRIWCHPAWAGFLIFLLGIFWTARKMIGAV